MKYKLRNEQTNFEKELSEEECSKFLDIWTDGIERFENFINSDDKEMEIFIGGQIKVFTIIK